MVLAMPLQLLEHLKELVHWPMTSRSLSASKISSTVQVSTLQFLTFISTRYVSALRGYIYKMVCKLLYLYIRAGVSKRPRGTGGRK